MIKKKKSTKANGHWGDAAELDVHASGRGEGKPCFLKNLKTNS